MIQLTGEPLTSDDLKALAARWIDPVTAHAQLLRRVISWEGAKLVGAHSSHDDDYVGIAIPYLWPGEDYIREYRLRRDYPEIENGKPRRKYVSPPGRCNLLYFPVGTDPAMLADSTLPVVFTEGEFKAIALARHGGQSHRRRWKPDRR
jgi:hypothetical protein